jgi:hypothetical protein
MNVKPLSRTGAYWRERFLAIAREAEAALPRVRGRSRAGIRLRLSGIAPERRFAALAARP